MIQSIRRELNGVKYVEGKSGEATRLALAKLTDWQEGKEYTFKDLEDAAKAADVCALVDANAQRFLNPGSMTGEVMAAAAENGRAPSTVGELIKCVYRSLAECYARAIRDMEKITGVE